MRAKPTGAPVVSWASQKGKMRRDGSMLRFKLGTSAPPVSSVARGDLLVSLQSVVASKYVGLSSELQNTPIILSNEDEEADQDVRLWFWNKTNHFVEKTCYGGLRGDPFDTFPIPNKGHVPGAFDYYTQVWFDLCAQMPYHRTPEGRLRLTRQYFAIMLADEMFFEQCVAFAIFFQGLRTSTGFTDRLSYMVTRHINSVIRILRSRIATGQGTSDATILTMICLAGVCMIANDFRSLEIHCNAIKNAVDLRGGYDNLGFDGFLKINALTIVGIQEARNQVGQGQQQLDLSRSVKTKIERLEHPFPPDLCTMIGRLPEGLQELSLTTELSRQHIDALVASAGWIQRGDGSPAQIMAILMALPDSTPTACLLSQTLFGYFFGILDEGHLDPSQVRLGHLIMQTSIGRLKSGVSFDKCSPDFVVWAYLVLQHTTEMIEPESWRWATQKLSSVHMDLEMLQKLEDDFLPVPGIREVP